MFLGDPSTVAASGSPLLVGVIGASLTDNGLCIGNGVTQRTDWQTSQEFLKEQGVAV